MKVRQIVRSAGEFTLYPLSDVHYPVHDHDKLSEWRDQVHKDETAIVTLGGDMLDFARGTYRKFVGSYTADDNSRSPLDEYAFEKVSALAEFLRPISSKVIGVCVGNHFWRFANGRVSDQELALQMGIGDKFVGALGLFNVRLGKKGSIKIAMHHDAGRRGGTASADMLAFQHWSHGVAADIYIAGHTHRQYVGIYQTRITIDQEDEKISDQKLVFIRSGAFMKGYSNSIIDPEAPFIPDYAEVAMLPPSVLGIISVKVEISQKGKLQYTLQQRTL